MRTLALIRHAKSSWKDQTLADFDRPLNKRGRHNAPFMGKTLRSLGLGFDLIISSPATRALTTARLIADKLDYPDKRIGQDQTIYEASAGELLSIVHAIDDTYERVALIGHNPGLSQFAEQLCNDEPLDMPTCAVALIEFKVPTWQAIGQGDGILRAYEYPKKYPEAS